MVSSLVSLLLVTLAHASQDAAVSVNEASVHEKPSAESRVIETLRSGAKVRVSDQTKDGWYQTRLKGGGLGWIRVGEVLPDSLNANLKYAGIVAADPLSSRSGRYRFILSGFFDATYLSPSSLQETGIALGYSVALGYRPKTDWTIRARYDSVRFEKDDVLLQAGIASLFVEYAVVHAKPWKLEFGIGPAMSLGADWSSTSSAVTISAKTPSSPGGIAKLHAHWYFIDRMSLGLEVGYRYFLPKDTEVGGAAVETQLSAPFAGAGLQLEL